MRVVSLAAALVLSAGLHANRSQAAEPVAMTGYTDPAQALPWGLQSHWTQPWRSYLETVPSETLLKAIGINFNIAPNQAAATAKLLGDAGFRRARIEVGWNSLDYDNPQVFDPKAREALVAKLTALKENGIRPLILLNANQGGPCPVKRDTVTLTQAAAKGDKVVHLDPSDAAKVVLNHSGITSGGIAARYLFTSVTSNGEAHLAVPLASDLPAGNLKIETLRYEPFHPANESDGSPNPRFESTMRGWLNYVGVVTSEVETILGSENFDVEIWNELTFGSAFLDYNYYYEPDVEWTHYGNIGQILDRTVAYIRDPVHGVDEIGIGDGFSNQRPWDSGLNTPLGLTAIDKHPYAGLQRFPQADADGTHQMLNGLNEVDGTWDANKDWHATFTPTYDAYFPEMFLSAIETETLVHDLSPYPSLVAGAEHGRLTKQPGQRPPEYWITEVNLDPTEGPLPRSSMSQADIRHIETKNVLRYITAFVNKGVTAIDLFAASAGNLSLVDPAFLNAARNAPSADPALGGETIAAVHRLTEAMRGTVPISDPRQLSLRKLVDYNSNFQFPGNGTAAYPPLYNRDVFGFFPFQANPHRFVIPLYVMTRNVTKIYDADDAEPSRFDLPPETFDLEIAGVEPNGAIVSSLDPVTGEEVPAEIVSSSEDAIVVRTQVTDSPRLLTIQEAAGASEALGTPVLVWPSGSPLEEPFPPGYSESDQPSEGSPPENDPPEESPASKSKKPQEFPARPSSNSTENPPRSPVTYESEESKTPRLSLQGGRSFLRKHRLVVVARCEEGCKLSARGKLSIAGRSFPIKPHRQSSPDMGGHGRTSLELAIRGSAARIGVSALKQGARVRAVVTVHIQTALGAEHTRSFSLRPR